MPKPHTSHRQHPHRKSIPAVVAQDDHPPPEDELGGGDICSIEEAPSTDDDKPLG